LIKVNDKWLRIALPALPCSLFLYDFLVSDDRNMQANLIYIITTILVCEGSRYLFYRSMNWFKEPHKKSKRILALIPSGITLVAILFVISKGLRNYFAFGSSGMDTNFSSVLIVNDKQVELGTISMSIVYGVFIFLILLSIYELAFHFALLRSTERQRDRLEKEKLQAELQQLKGIVNPHFLFNNLNSLSSLINENPSKAEDFLDELTKVFRYLLRNNDTELTTLAQELEFMNSYCHLLQTRYGQGFSVEVNIDRVCESYLLPPLTLQLLVENAVKHNQVDKEEPLRIELFSDEERRLMVRNNLSVKKHAVESTGIGLRSINSRYTLLNHEPPTVRKDAGFFWVVIPLIPASETQNIKMYNSESLLPG
jgi:two-component system, LytTR family, sensor kinase